MDDEKIPDVPDTDRATARSTDFSSTKPLPPIGAKSEEGVAEKSDGSKSEADSIEAEESLTVFDRSDSDNGARPRIVRGFKPESTSELTVAEDDSKMSRSISFNETSPPKFTVKTYDGREVTMVTMKLQTDWDWVQKKELGNKTDGLKSSSSKLSKTSSTTLSKKPTISFMSVNAQDSACDSPVSRSSSKAGTPDPKLEDGEFPQPYNDEYGIPILDLSSDTDDYQRESQKNEIHADDPDNRTDEEGGAGKVHGMFSGKCEFCNKPIKSFPTVDEQMRQPPEVLYCCSEYREFVEFVLTTTQELENEETEKNKMIDVKPHEHVGTKQERNAAKEKAVQRMRERELARRQQEASGLPQNFFASSGGRVGGVIKTVAAAHMTMKDMFEELDKIEKASNDFKQNCTKNMSVDSDSEASSSQARNFELEDEHRLTKLSLLLLKWYRGTRTTVARQMKTINYQLSSQKCLEEGWTIRAPSPLYENEGDDVFIPEPLNPDMLKDGKLRDRPLIEKFYASGQKFLTMFPDGTGNVFYPSGNLAILVSSVKLGQYYYTIHHDVEKSGVAAAFEPSGYGYCYFPNGDIRLYIDQYGGIELDTMGGRRRRWSWKGQVTHVHAPPFQPICIGLNKTIGVRVMSQDNITLTFSSGQRACRFNMGSRLKLVAPENAPLKEIEEDHIFLEEKKTQVDALLSKVANLLKFPNNPKLEKMLPPLHVTSKQNKTEKLKKERQHYLEQQSAREKKQASISVT